MHSPQPIADADSARHNMTRTNLPMTGVVINDVRPESSALVEHEATDVLTEIRKRFGDNVEVTIDGDTTLVYEPGYFGPHLGYAYPTSERRADRLTRSFALTDAAKANA